MTIHAYLDDWDIDVVAVFDIMPIASAIGCPKEHAGQYAGQLNVKLHRCYDLILA